MDEKKKMGIAEFNKIINPKSIVISGDVHEWIKTHTTENGVKVSFFIEDLFLTFKSKENGSK
jgi:hypothetical protein